MLKRPILAIVGRPNVGKSALFNRIVQKKIAIVDEAEGITRDRLYSEAEAFGCEFTLIDTGGMDPLSSKNFAAEILAQAKMAVEEADTLVMVVDAQVGLTALDEKIAKILHKAKKPLCLAVNKIESPNHEILIHQFYRLGIPNIFAISAIHGHHVEDLLVKALEGFTSPPVEEIKDDKTARVAIIGRPNVGKSTLVNAMLGEERTIVSPLAGTTRDAIDIPLSYDDKNYLLIDTAGMRRRSAEKEAVDKFAAIRTKYAIERSHLVILVLDAVEGLSQKEKQIMMEVERAGKGCIIVMNKWDLIKGFRMEHCKEALVTKYPFLAPFPFLFISAKEQRNVEKLFPMIDKVMESLQKRPTTHSLNKFLERAIHLNAPPAIQGRRLRIYYMTQVEIFPPQFLLFCNYPQLLTDTYKKYLLNQLRTNFDFEGAPIFFYLKGKAKRKIPSKTPPEYAAYNQTAPEAVDEDEDEDGLEFEMEEDESEAFGLF